MPSYPTIIGVLHLIIVKLDNIIVHLIIVKLDNIIYLFIYLIGALILPVIGVLLFNYLELVWDC